MATTTRIWLSALTLVGVLLTAVVALADDRGTGSADRALTGSLAQQPSA